MTKKCELAVGTRENIVARGCVMPSTPHDLCHGVVLGDDNACVMIEIVLNPTPYLPIQAFDVSTVGEACGSFCAWPKYLIVYPEDEVNIIFDLIH